MNLKTAIANAHTAAQDFATAADTSFRWPCGVAWVEFKCRKNAKEAKELVAAGARWDDYAKVYSISVPTPTQSMDFNEAACDVFVKAMDDAGIEGFYRRSQID